MLKIEVKFKAQFGGVGAFLPLFQTMVLLKSGSL
jgi:hypothetical protein